MAIIAVDSSGHVGQPPIYCVAVRLKQRFGITDFQSQLHKILYIEQEFHDSFVDKTFSWKLKLSSVLIYSVVIPMLKGEDKIIIDVDFDSSNQKSVIRYINKLLFTYNRETPLQQCHIEFLSNQNEFVKIADWKASKARHKIIQPNLDTHKSIINERFGVLSRIN